jgi:hypothetical protein
MCGIASAAGIDLTWEPRGTRRIRAARGRAAGGGLALAVPAPAAAATAQNGRVLDVRFPSPKGAAACASRQITLDPGRYKWRLGHSFSGWPSPVWESNTVTGNLTVRREYSCVDCLIAEQYGGDYTHVSTPSWPGSSAQLAPETATTGALEAAERRSATRRPSEFGSSRDGVS